MQNRTLWLTLLSFVLVACGADSASVEVTEAPVPNEASGRLYTPLGLEGVYLVEPSGAKSVFDSYGIEYDFLAEIISNKPLLFSLCEGGEEAQWNLGRGAGDATVYQYFLFLRSSTDSEELSLDAMCSVTVATNDDIVFSEALKMKSEEIYSGTRSRTTVKEKIEIPPLPPQAGDRGQKLGGLLVRQEGMGSKGDGVFSIWRFVRLLVTEDAAESPVGEQVILSLDVRSIKDQRPE